MTSHQHLFRRLIRCTILSTTVSGTHKESGRANFLAKHSRATSLPMSWLEPPIPASVPAGKAKIMVPHQTTTKSHGLAYFFGNISLGCKTKHTLASYTILETKEQTWNATFQGQQVPCEYFVKRQLKFWPITRF